MRHVKQTRRWRSNLQIFTNKNMSLSEFTCNTQTLCAQKLRPTPFAWRSFYIVSSHFEQKTELLFSQSSNSAKIGWWSLTPVAWWQHAESISPSTSTGGRLLWQVMKIPLIKLAGGIWLPLLDGNILSQFLRRSHRLAGVCYDISWKLAFLDKKRWEMQEGRLMMWGWGLHLNRCLLSNLR